MKKQALSVQGNDIRVLRIGTEDYICLTDMAKSGGDDARAADVIKNWIRNRATIEFLGTWEGMYNKDFKVVEFDHFRKQAGLHTFTMSVSHWIESTGAVGIVSKQGKLGGTYAHRDIAFEFGGAISPVFKLYVIKEYQRLKQIENDQYGLEWNVRRILAKSNNKIHTDAVKQYIIPVAGYTKAKEWVLYADEADLLNIALFGTTAKEWRDSNQSRALSGENIRDMASINELAVLSTLESLNAILIKRGMSKAERFRILRETAIDQKASLDSLDVMKSVKKLSDSTFVDLQDSKNQIDE